MRETTLLPCPFCGGEADGLVDGIGLVARCKPCCVDFVPADIWNRRAHPAAPAGMVRSGFYVASRVHNAGIWQRYRADGVPINSTWIDEAGDGDTLDFGELWARIHAEIDRSEALVFYATQDDFPLKGAYVEVGMALALGVPVRIVLDGVTLKDRTMRPVGSWILAHGVTRYDTLDAALAASQPEQKGGKS